MHTVQVDSDGLVACASVGYEPGSARWWIQRSDLERRRRPRLGGLSTERIIGAALDVLREDGLDALTVRAVAERLGTSNASLYRHIASRDELIALIGDHVMGDIRIGRTGRGWRADIEVLMSEMRRVILNQPLPDAAGRNMHGYGPNMLRFVNAAVTAFDSAGLPRAEAVYTTIAMIELVAGAATIQRSRSGRSPSGVPAGAGFEELLDRLPPDDVAALRETGDVYLSAPVDAVFAHSMAIFLDGVTSRLPTGH
ncbi:TetR family transcriptional regulator [Frankia sp. R43]|uniref:TetR/AcrR family transcriptional regulator n=1 Tax=Frankia sp. R43 TaxID=269536 RepID=UPI0006CA3910|nr:TetR/AcrR family transcriptional regulator [Frankia sp. R43]KPM55380.1 TetR family transcriptional regulator [Frankia sp. R43]